MITSVGISPITPALPNRESERPTAAPSTSAPSQQSKAGLRPQSLGGTSALFAQEEGKKPEQGPKLANDLTDEEKQQVAALKKRDAEVKAHEAAHRAAGGQIAGAASYGYEKGPDGRRYATSGEVPLTIKEDPSNPDATLQNLRTVKRAALAPSRPSSADLRIAAQAEAKMAQVRAEKASQAREEFGESSAITASEDPEKTNRRNPYSGTKPQLLSEE